MLLFEIVINYENLFGDKSDATLSDETNYETLQEAAYV